MNTTNSLAPAVIKAITVGAPLKLSGTGGRDWTRAIWLALQELAASQGFNIYPAEGPYKGEYLLDFVLWQPKYGPRVLVESQWQYWAQDSTAALEWAFDKLVGVKGDLKVLIFEWVGLNSDRLPSLVEEKLTNYLLETQLHLASEHYLFIWYCGENFQIFEWRPIRTGGHSKDEIVITPYKQ